MATISTHRVAAIHHGWESGTTTAGHVDNTTMWQLNGTQGGGASAVFMFNPTFATIYRGHHKLFLVDVTNSDEALLEFSDHVNDAGDVVTTVTHHQGFDYVQHGNMRGDPTLGTGGLRMNIRGSTTEFRIYRTFLGDSNANAWGLALTVYDGSDWVVVSPEAYKFRIVSIWNCDEEVSTLVEMALLQETQTAALINYSEKSSSLAITPVQEVAECDRSVAGVYNVRSWDRVKQADLNQLSMTIESDSTFPARVIRYAGRDGDPFRIRCWASANQTQEHQIVLQKSTDDGVTWDDLEFGSLEVAEMGGEVSKSVMDCVLRLDSGDRLRIYHIVKNTRIIDGRGLETPEGMWNAQTASAGSVAYMALYAQLQIQSLTET